MEVSNPSHYVILEFLFPDFISIPITTTGQFFEFRLQLNLGFGMYSQETLSFHHIERVAQELNSSYIRYNRLFTVHFKEEFPFYEPGY